MKGDFTRSTFDPKKQYSGVRLQQGRVLLDSDFNEQVDIQAHLSQTEAGDVIGACGAPQGNAGFGIGVTEDEQDLTISPGRFYVDGILCELGVISTYSTQPDYPNPEPLTEDGIYLAYLDVWQRHITALEEPTIREVALGGPDTTTRTKTICQVKLLRAGDLLDDDDDALNCLSDFDWQDTIAPGQMQAHTAEVDDETEPCPVPAQAGYRGLENQLYRVEIHNVNSETGIITIKWSRENGSVVAAWTGQDELQPEKLTINNPGRDAVLGFGPDQWVELTDDVRELKGLSGTLVKVVQVDGSVLTIDTGAINLRPTPTPQETDFSQAHNPKIRRWDMPGDTEITVDLSDDETWIPLENGIEVKFEAGRYHTGDYWLIPARTATGDIESGEALAQLPQGIAHHYCRLALLSYNGETWDTEIQDCRPQFPPLTEMTRFFYIGGNGQEAIPGNPLPQRLQVGVMNGAQPVVGCTVRFTALDAGGQVANTVADLPDATHTLPTTTNESGVANCVWQLQDNPDTPSQLVTAVLLDAAGDLTDHPPLIFNANLSIARQVAYEQPEECEELAEATTVQQALDILCNLERGAASCAITVGTGGQFPSLEGAIQMLQGREHICICLLPGVHRLSGSVVFNGVTVEITGCGVGSHIILDDILRTEGVESFALKNLAVEVRNVNEAEAALMFYDFCEVTIRDCHLTSVITEPPPEWSLLRFENVNNPEQLNRIHLANNLIHHPFGITTGGLAMHVRTPFTDVILENNRIDGAIAFLGDRSIDTVLGRAAAVNIARTIEDLGLIATQNSLHLRNNHISQVAATDFLHNLTAVYQNAFVTDNHFEGIQNTFVAQHVALTTNVFASAANPVGMAAGATATYIGNRSSDPQLTAELWNLAPALQSTEGLNLMLRVVTL